MGSERSTDIWADAAAYESYIGRWSRPVAREFVRWIAAPARGAWLDVGCGTGTLSQAILALAAPREVVGVDSSEGYVRYASEHVNDSAVRFDLGDARSLSYPAGTFDAVVSGLMLNFVLEPAAAVGEMTRVARARGTVAAYVWDYAIGMQLMRHFWDAAVALDPAALELDEGQRFLLCKPEPLAELFRTAGLRAVDVRAIDVPTRFRDFDDYWSPFLGGQGPAPGYVMALPGERRATLRDRIRAFLPVAADGTIGLTARA